MTRIFVLTLFLFSKLSAAQSQEVSVIKDLQSEWKEFSANAYKKYDVSKKTSVIHFLVDASGYRGAFLQIESKKDFSVFVNKNLIAAKKVGTILFDLDSLSKQYSKELSFSIVRSAVDVSTVIVRPALSNAEDQSLIARKQQHFFNFSILASFILLFFLVILIRTNPKLTSDYLNFVKLFSVQEREENIMTIRITSSANLLFYTFASLFSAFLLMVIFHFAYARLIFASSFQVHSVKEGFYQWLILSVIILLTLVGKLVLVSVFSYLYKATEITALQFFNFIRLFFFTFGVISLLAIFFFIGNIQDPAWYYNLFYFGLVIFIFWEIVIFLKLMRRVPFRIFHLFFYLCASELIPLVIIIKVVFY